MRDERCGSTLNEKGNRDRNRQQTHTYSEIERNLKHMQETARGTVNASWRSMVGDLIAPPISRSADRFKFLWEEGLRVGLYKQNDRITAKLTLVPPPLPLRSPA
jgi:hypothetical protein